MIFSWLAKIKFVEGVDIRRGLDDFFHSSQDKHLSSKVRTYKLKGKTILSFHFSEF